MEKLKKLILVLFTACFISMFIMPTIQADAALRDGNAYSFRLYSPRGTWRPMSTNAEVNSLWQTGFSRANQSSSGISLTRVSSGTPTIFTYEQTSSSYDWVGHYSGSTNGGVGYLHLRNMNSLNFTAMQKRKVAIHEVGHALGLRHQSSSINSVMRQGRMTANDFTTIDKNNIIWGYGR